MFINVKKYEPGWRPAFSAIVVVGWLIFIIAWLAFFSADFQPYEKKIAVFLLSLLIIIVLLGSVWAIWAVRMIPSERRQMMKFFGFRSRIILSMITPLGAITFLIYYFWFYDFTIWQHIAMIIITVLVVGMILAGIWSSWEEGTCSDFEEKMEKMGEEIGKNIEESIKKKFDEEEK
jgi:hypothetical protein